MAETRPPKLLVVDDEAPLRLLLQEVLGELGHVATAANGQEALAFVGQHFCDVVLSDVDMPLLDGEEFFESIVTQTQRRRFVFMTGHPRATIQETCRQYQLPLVTKPFRLDDLRRAVEGVLRRDEDLGPTSSPPAT